MAASGIDLYRTSTLPDGDLRVMTLLSYCGDTVLGPADGEKEYTKHLVDMIRKFYKPTDDIIPLTMREIIPQTGFSGVMQAMSAFFRGVSIVGSHEVREVALSSCSAADVDAILSDPEACDRILLGCLEEHERQWGRYRLFIDGKTFSSHLALYDHLIGVYKGDKSKVLKMLIFMSETVGSETLTVAYKRMSDPYKGLILRPLLQAQLSVNTAEEKIEQSENYSLCRFDSLKGLERITSFKLVHELNLSSRVVERKIVHPLT